VRRRPSYSFLQEGKKEIKVRDGRRNERKKESKSGIRSSPHQEGHLSEDEDRQFLNRKFVLPGRLKEGKGEGAGKAGSRE